jgi:hypothetical protein
MSKTSIIQRLTKLEQPAGGAARVFIICSNDPQAEAKLAEAQAFSGDKTIIRIKSLWTPNGEITSNGHAHHGA